MDDKKEKPIKPDEEYRLLSTLEQSTTIMRYSVFTAILSISFIIPAMGATVVNMKCETTILGQSISIFPMLFTFGFEFYCLAVFHYWWYHRYAHRYRKRLKELEQELRICIYGLRKRPNKEINLFGKKICLKMHFDWALYIIGILYALIDVSFIGWKLFGILFAIVLVIYILFTIFSIFTTEEPLE